MDTAMRRVALLFVFLCCACGRGERPQVAAQRVPDWATPTPGTGYDEESGLPREVTHEPTRLRLLLIPVGTYEWPTETERARPPRYPSRVTIKNAFYTTDGFYFPPGALLHGSVTVMPVGFRFLSKDEATACLFVLARSAAYLRSSFDWGQGFLHEGFWHVSIGRDP